MNTSSRPLHIDSDLVLTSPDQSRIRVSSQGRRLDVDLDPRLLSLKTGRLVPPLATRRGYLAKLQWFLRRADLSLAVAVRGIPIADMEGEGAGTFSAKLLGLAPMRLHPWGLLRALWGRRR